MCQADSERVFDTHSESLKLFQVHQCFPPTFRRPGSGAHSAVIPAPPILEPLPPAGPSASRLRSTTALVKAIKLAQCFIVTLSLQQPVFEALHCARWSLPADIGARHIHIVSDAASRARIELHHGRARFVRISLCGGWVTGERFERAVPRERQRGSTPSSVERSNKFCPGRVLEIRSRILQELLSIACFVSYRGFV